MRFSIQEGLKPSGLRGISPTQIQQHWELYKGYVVNANELFEALAAAKPGAREWSELKRRAAFEFNGVALHELYFGNLAPELTLDPQSALAEQVAQQWGGVSAWLEDLAATGAMRGIGWAMTYHDTGSGALQDWWIGEHDLHHPVGLTPILVMDVWEHAYMVDHGATGRGAYIQAFLRNINWRVVEQRFAASADCARAERATASHSRAECSTGGTDNRGGDVGGRTLAHPTMEKRSETERGIPPRS